MRGARECGLRRDSAFGRPATADEIRRVDIDVGPDGAGLPAGSGSAAQGAPIYAAKCAGCHGPAGEGTPVAVALVGRNPGDAFDFAAAREKERTKTVGNYWPYATTLYDYIHRAMPFDKPGTLAPDEVYSLVAVHSGEERHRQGRRGDRRAHATRRAHAGARPFRARRSGASTRVR